MLEMPLQEGGSFNLAPFRSKDYPTRPLFYGLQGKSVMGYESPLVTE